MTNTRKTAKKCPVCQLSGCTLWPNGNISCTTHRSGQKGNTLSGYKFLKTDRVGLGTWVKLGTKAADTYTPAPKLVQVDKTAPVDFERRSRQFAAWAFANGLSSTHKAKLEDRGLTAEQIKQLGISGLLWSVERLDNPRHDALPGLWDAKRGPGYWGYEGMAIACRQYKKGRDGELMSVVLGAQIGTGLKKPHPKYPWLSKGGNAQIPQFKNENPITIHRTSDDDAQHIVLTEGILKPLVALHRAQSHGIDLGLAVMGAAGCSWASSAWHQISAQCELLGAKEIRLALDAGAPSNANVMRGAKALERKCSGSGLRFSIIWYGQFEKSDGDIDELSKPVEYELLSVAEVARRQKARPVILANGTAIAPPPAAPVTNPNVTATPGFCQDYGYMPNAAAELFPAMYDQEIRLIAIVGDCGTGKTQLIKGYLEYCAERSELEGAEYEPFTLALTHRNALGEAQGELLGLPVKSEISAFGDYQGYVLTADSAHVKNSSKFNGFVPPHGRVLIDEADQFADHVTSSGTAIRHVRQEVIENICEAGQRAKQTIIMSAGLTDLHIALYQQSMGISPAECITIVNTHKRDMGKVYQCSEAVEVWARMDEALSGAERFMCKLSGQRDTSLFSTQTAKKWIAERYPDTRALFLDSESCNDPSNPDTNIQAEVLVRGTDGAYACALMEVEGDGGGKKLTAKRTQQRILSYLNHADGTLKRIRQAEVFSRFDCVFFTNACSTGISFEAGGFSLFLQIENGAGSIDDCMQSAGRLRYQTQRYIYAKPAVPAPHGNGSAEPLELQAGKDRSWKAQQQAIEAASADYLPSNELLAGGNLGALWRGYSLQIQAKRNEQARTYGVEFFALLEAANYEIAPAFVGSWAGLSPKKQAEFKQAVKDTRDRSSAANDEETASRDTEGKDLKKLSAKLQRTRGEAQTISKMRAMERYGLEADEISPELMNAEKKGLHQRLLNRYYLELGTAAAAERDAAKIKKALTKGRTWQDDLLKGSFAYRVQLQQKIGLDTLIEYLKGTDDDGQPRTIHKNSPEVQSVVRKMVTHRDELKSVFRLTVGKLMQTYLEDGSTKSYVEVSDPLTHIKTMLKALELDIKAGKQLREGSDRTRLYALTDRLIVGKGDEAQPLIDYSKFAELRAKYDAETLAESAAIAPPEILGTANVGTANALNNSNKHLLCLKPETPVEPDQPTSSPVSLAGGGAADPADLPIPLSEAEQVLMFRLAWCQSSDEFGRIRSELAQHSTEFQARYWALLPTEAQQRITEMCQVIA